MCGWVGTGAGVVIMYVWVTHRDGRVDDLDVPFLDEDFARFEAQPLDLFLRYRLAPRELLYLSTRVSR